MAANISIPFNVKFHVARSAKVCETGEKSVGAEPSHQTGHFSWNDVRRLHISLYLCRVSLLNEVRSRCQVRNIL